MKGKYKTKDWIFPKSNPYNRCDQTKNESALILKKKNLLKHALRTKLVCDKMHCFTAALVS